MDRRTLVHLLGTAGIGGIAGCTTQGGGSQATPATTETPMTNQSTDTPTATDSGLVTRTTDESVSTAVDRITADIEASELTLVTTVDHAANAASAGLELPPTTLLVFGNPNVGTPLMQASRSAAIDLPQKLLVWDDDGQTKVTYNDPEYLAQRHGIDGQDERLAQIRSVLDGLATVGSETPTETGS